MADIFVYDGGSNTSPYETWAKASTTIATALGAAAAGDTIIAASDHSEAAIGASISANGIGTSASPLIIKSQKRTDDTYENMVTGGGRMVQSGTSSDWNLGEWAIWMGMDIFVADNLLATNAGTHQVIDSKLEVNDDFVAAEATQKSKVIFENVDYVQATLTAGLNMGRCHFRWSGGSFTFNGGSLTTLIVLNTEGGSGIIEDVDLSVIPDSDFLIEADQGRAYYIFKRCLLNASPPTFVNGTISNENYFAKFYSCSSSDIVYQFHEASFYGTVDDDTANYLNATADGSVGYSSKMVVNTTSLEFFKPLRFKLAEVWAAANPTLTVEVITAGVTLQDDEFWIEVEYPDGTIKAQGNRMSSKVGATGEGDWMGDPNAAPANLTTSTESWTEVLASEVKQKIALTITGGGTGVHTIWACGAKAAGFTVYVDPKITVT